MASPVRRVSGHLRTVGHLVGNLLRPPPAPPAEAWKGRLEDPAAGTVAVSGWLSRAGGEAALVILVHGLGGSADSPYLCHAARVARELGLDTLRLNLRGADPVAGDFYHGGLTAELHAAVADRALAGYERIAVLGYSMGGHVALRYAAEAEDPRLAVVGAVCSPLHLAPVSAAFDQPSRRLYRYWVLRHLRRCFDELERAGVRLPHPAAEVRRARSFRHWDALTVVPRFGFADADDYYARASAAAVLDRLRVPCLLIASEIDPVVPPAAIQPYLPPHAAIGRFDGDLEAVGCRRSGDRRAADFTLLWCRGAGHVAFPAGLELERRLLGWLGGAPRPPEPPAARAGRRSGRRLPRRGGL